MELYQKIAAIEQLLDQEQWDEAQRELAAIDAKEEQDTSAHHRLGMLAERMGDSARALLEYNLALRDQPGQPLLLQKIARLRTERGEWQQAMQVYQKWLAIQPENAATTLELGALLEQTDQLPDAKRYYQWFLAAHEHPEVQSALRRVERLLQHDHSSGRDEEERQKSESRNTWMPNELDAVIFAHLFAGREGVYARQWKSSHGNAGYTPVYEPLTAAVARNHLLGHYTVGAYPVRMDNTVLFAAIDLDLTQHTLSKQVLLHQSSLRDSLLREVHAVAKRLLDAATMYDLPAYIEDSGWKGRHLWFFFEEPIPATAARRLARWLIRLAGPFPAEVQIEIFPKQSRVDGQKLGNLIKLPLGIHQVSGRRCVFLSPDDQPISDPIAHLHQIKRIARSAVRQLVATAEREEIWEPSPPDTHPLDSYPDLPAANRMASPGEYHEATTSLRPEQIPQHPDDDIEYQWLLQKCHVLREVNNRALSTGILSRDEQHALRYTVGHITHGRELVNQMLSGLLNAEPTSFLKSRLRGNPMSCPKIRSKLPDIASSVDCHCLFDPDVGMYPNPLLHLHGLKAQGVLSSATTQTNSLQIERMVMDLFRTRQDLKRLSRLEQDIENRLNAILDDQDLSQLQTPAGMISRTSDGQIALSVGPAHIPPPKTENTSIAVDSEELSQQECDTIHTSKGETR